MRDQVRTLHGLGTQVPMGTVAGTGLQPPAPTIEEGLPHSPTEPAFAAPNLAAPVEPAFAPPVIDEAAEWEERLSTHPARLSWLPAVAVGLGAVGLLALIVAAFIPASQALGLTRDAKRIAPVALHVSNAADGAAVAPNVAPAPQGRALHGTRKASPAAKGGNAGAKPGVQKATAKPGSKATAAKPGTKTTSKPPAAAKTGKSATELYGRR